MGEENTYANIGTCRGEIYAIGPDFRSWLCVAGFAEKIPVLECS